jgi:RNA polymerase sigma-70 factor (ECF subfamily)
MEPNSRARLEEQIRELCARGEIHEAVVVVLRGYGSELKEFMRSQLPNPEWAQEAFSAFCESLLKDLPAFRWESSFRYWAYRVARHVCYRVSASARREVPVSRGAFDQAAQRERSGTQPWQRTELKDRFRVLREQLDPVDQRLLVLRIDRQLAWTDIAREMISTGEPPTPEVLDRKATALRQRFKRLKARLRELFDGDVLPAA